MNKKRTPKIGDRVRLTCSGGFGALQGDRWKAERGTVIDVQHIGRDVSVKLCMDEGTQLPGCMAFDGGWTFLPGEYEVIDDREKATKEFFPGDIVSLEKAPYYFGDNPKVGCVVRKLKSKKYVVFTWMNERRHGLCHKDGWTMSPEWMELIYRHEQNEAL